MINYFGNIENETELNTNFRKVLFTGAHAQLVVMSLNPSEEIGREVHPNVDQFFRIEQGSAKFVIDGSEMVAEAGFAVIVPAGAWHNVVNASDKDYLKLYTIYSPANHPEGTLHATKADADKAEDVGHKA